VIEHRGDKRRTEESSGTKHGKKNENDNAKTKKRKKKKRDDIQENETMKTAEYNPNSRRHEGMNKKKPKSKYPNQENEIREKGQQVASLIALLTPYRGVRKNTGGCDVRSEQASSDSFKHPVKKAT
jgi:hypothetical protein